MQQPIMCPRCGSPNALGQRFCWNCGTSLETGCPNCGASLDPGAMFCGNCGAQLPPQQQTGGWGQPPPQQQSGGWGQPPPQQQPGGWVQPPPQQQSGGWGQPPPQQQPGGWGQPQQQPGGWGQPQQQPGAWGQPPPQTGAWAQPVQRRKSGAGWLIIVLIVLLIGLGTLGYFAFFSDNPPWGGSSGAGTTTSGIEEGPFPFLISTDNITGTSEMEIRWKTVASYKGQIEYGSDTTYGSTSDWESDFVKDHVVPLSNLQAATSYSYRIIMKNEKDQEWKSNNYTFTVPSTD